MRSCLHIALFVWMALWVNCLSAQKGKADRLYRKIAFAKAAPLYEKALAKKDDPLRLERLADCYWQLGNMKKAEQCYAKLSENPEAGVGVLYRYAQTLKSGGKYEEAQSWFRTYAEKAGKPEEGECLAASCRKAEDLRQDSARYEISTLPFNSPWSDICPVIYRNGIVFTSNRPHGNFLKATSSLDNAPFYDLFYVKPDPLTTYTEPEFLPGRLNTRYHDGPAAFSEAQHIAYLTRSNLSRGRVRRDVQKVNHMGIFRSKLVANRWVALDALPFNSEDYSTAHPSLDKDEITLYFSSDMPGGFGGKDLYVTTWTDSGWTPAENLGSEVNTEGNEVFPSIHTDGTLYFASTGHAGLGGLDVFSAVKASGHWGKVRNLGYPINTSWDDFGLVWKSSNSGGYFSSNRPGGRGDDDIYYVERKAYLFGKVVSDRDEKPLSGIEVRILGQNGDTSLYASNLRGEFDHPIRHGERYRLLITSDRFKPLTFDISTRGIPVSDDIRAEFRMISEASFNLFIQVTESGTGNPIAQAMVVLEGDRKREIRLDNKGQWKGELPLGIDFTGNISADGFEDSEIKFTTRDIEGTVEYVIERSLERRKVTAKPPQGAFVATRTTNSDTPVPARDFTGPRISVTGTVTDPQGNPVAGARIRGTEWWGQATTGQSRTDAQGNYKIEFPVKKTHAVAVDAPGFKPGRRKEAAGREWGKSDALTISFQLEAPASGDLLVQVPYFKGQDQMGLFAYKDLDEMADWIAVNPGWVLELEGLAEPGWATSRAQDLAARRAAAGQKYLLGKGVPASSLVVLPASTPQSSSVYGLNVRIRKAEKQ
ncbi:MAG: carboxypeptidase regulatory-like domain-containing protein [Bacteroidia bacterium]|nr:carboxypeptidase regulatory-like domain-containing protein [Bacteroidia bacterium]